MVQGLSALYRTGQQDAIRVDSTLIRGEPRLSLGPCLLGQSGLVNTLHACRAPSVGESQVCPAFRVGGDSEQGRGWSNVASSD